ncbi:hypothetical protein SLS62_004178 [Diatrype stigma]|uniref:Uncharacterized protein n=1 Tax=Diatrype stigma TaxID=117547 RepID=A0AAN9YTC1_9PEZI
MVDPLKLILPLTHQSQDISFSDWISILTLGLAPLIAHIVAGVPQISCLDGSTHHRPRWHDRICHYNPTSIIWRYAMIADRRIRARSWNRADAAAANALFWTSRGWDGSEAMVVASLPFCAHQPEHARAALISREMAKTVIVTLQGLQAGIPIVVGLTTTRAAASFVHWVGIDTVFSPLAVLGLLRLFCAFWLTDDFSYSAPQMVNKPPVMRKSLDNSLILPVDAQQPSVDPDQDRYRPTSFWASRIFRALYLLPVLAMIMTCTLYFCPWTKSPNDLYATTFTTTSFLLDIIYLGFAAATALICACYFARGYTTTIIPCISSLWYKMYTIVIMLLALTLLVLACVETRKTPCGRYTSGPGEAADRDACVTEELDVIYVGPNEAQFGLASTRSDGPGGNKSDDFWVGIPNALGSTSKALVAHLVEPWQAMLIDTD